MPPDTRLFVPTGAVEPAGRPPAPALPMGYQPALDGLRAVSVVAVLLYHAGFSWMNGGFFGVEVFFVVSGFLITSLLLEEGGRGAIDFKAFWLRRARRLLPAFFAVVVAVAVWTALWGSAAQVSQVKRDVPWSVVYLANWGQITGDTPYFAEDPSMLRHLWSLAVEEQWYLIWPLVVAALLAARWTMTRRAAVVAAVAAVVVATTFVLAAGGDEPLTTVFFGDVDRVNFLYLSTLTRAGGLLIGAAAAFVWRPWRAPGAADAPVGRILDPLGAAALALLACISVTAVLTEQYVYRWLLALVSVLSLVAVMAAVHPAAVGFRRTLGWKPLVEIGRRSYGLYLWSWPIFVVFGATGGSSVRFVSAMALTVLVTEVSYRYLETPIRQGALSRWWRQRPAYALAPLGAGVFLLVAVIAFFTSTQQYDAFADPAAAATEPVPAAEEPPSSVGGDDADPVQADRSRTATGPATSGAEQRAANKAGEPVMARNDSTVPAPLPSLAIVGDSQAHALAVNLPDTVATSFASVTNGSVDGCSVWDSGSVSSSVSFDNSFAICSGWQDKWAGAADGHDVTLVVIGAWDVFDVEDGAEYYTFGTTQADQRFTANLRSGIDAVLATGSRVALLEVPCMRPVDAAGAGVPPLPERGDDSRVAHVNQLVRSVADQYGSKVDFVQGPDEWCADEEIATDLGYRWDGVHVYRPGASLIVETITDDLTALAGV